MKTYLTDKDLSYIYSHGNEMTLTDIAAELDKPVSTVQSAWRTARAKGVVQRTPGRKVSEKWNKRPAGLKKEIVGRSLVTPYYCAAFLCANYDYIRPRGYPCRLYVAKGGKRSWSEKVLCDIYGLTVTEVSEAELRKIPKL